ncbi:MAG: 2-hydroxyacid dehydrogenase [Vicinamibacterales bacterium]
MRIAMFSAHRFDREFFERANARAGHDITYLESRLTPASSALARDFPAVCAFVNDRLDAEVLEQLHTGGTRIIALRSAGFNNVDLPRARTLGLVVVRVPSYSPHAVAEHAVALILALNRKIYRAYSRVREGNFALDGLLGFDLRGKTVAIIGTGRIGTVVARILSGFGCRLLGADPAPNDVCRALGVQYLPLEEIWPHADIVTLHTPLTPVTHHLIDAAALEKMRRGVMVINTGRGGLVDTRAVIDALKSGHIGYLGIDVYEEEEHLFFEDRSLAVLQDDVFARLLTFPNVIVTAHQAFFTHEALTAIAEATLDSVSAFERGGRSGREL